jgi:hypothetical protein
MQTNMQFETSITLRLKVFSEKVEGFQKQWYDPKARLNIFQMSTNVMGFQ